MAGFSTAATAFGSRAVMWLILLIGLALSLGAFWAASESDFQRARSALEIVAEGRAGDLDERIVDAMEAVEALADFIPSQSVLDPEEFSRFTQIARGEDPVSRLIWLPLAADRRTFGPPLESRFDSAPDLPDNGLGGEDFAALAWEARDGGEPIAEPVQLGGRTFFRVVWPVYGNGLPPKILESRRGLFSGVVVGEAPFDEMIRFAVANRRKVLGAIRLYVDHKEGEPFGVPLAIVQPETALVEIPREPLGPLAEGGLRLSRNIDLFGRRWTLIWDFPPKTVRRRESVTRWVVLAAGLALTFGTVASLFMERRRRRFAEDEVRRRTHDLQALIDASPVAIGVYDTERRVTLWNRVTEQLTGYSFEEVRGRTLPPNLAGALEELAGRLGDLSAGEVAHGLEVTALRKDGTPFHVIVSAAGLADADGRLRGFVTAALDISERRRVDATLQKTQTLLSAIVSSSDDAMISKTLDGIVTTWNPGAEKIFGYRAEEMVGQPISALAVPGREDDMRIVLDKMMRGERIDHYETQRRHKNGSIIDVSLSVSPIRDEQGRIVGASKIARDITAARAADSQRRQLMAQLYQAQKMEAVGALTGGMAHDFNNLLSVILGNLDFLSELEPPGSEGAEFVESAISAAVKGTELIRRLLAFARRQPLAPKLTNIASTLESAGQLFRRTLGGDIVLKMALADSLWPVMVDPAQLESTLLNLVVNSRHAMPNGGTLTIEARNATLEQGAVELNPEAGVGDYLVISVSDTGVGMDAATLAKVFEPFFTTKGSAGSGLGLSMVHGFVKQSGGFTRIYSEAGKGTSVIIYLPRAREQEAAEQAGLSADGMAKGNEVILVVEDSDEVREVVLRRLQGLGYRTIPAASAEEGLAIVKGGVPFDLLFTDVVMPGGMGGRELAEAARRLRPGLKVLFTSGFTAAAASAAMREEFGNNLLTKPYRKTELALRIRAVLDNSA